MNQDQRRALERVRDTCAVLHSFMNTDPGDPPRERVRSVLAAAAVFPPPSSAPMRCPCPHPSRVHPAFAVARGIPFAVAGTCLRTAPLIGSGHAESSSERHACALPRLASCSAATGSSSRSRAPLWDTVKTHTTAG